MHFILKNYLSIAKVRVELILNTAVSKWFAGFITTFKYGMGWSKGVDYRVLNLWYILLNYKKFFLLKNKKNFKPKYSSLGIHPSIFIKSNQDFMIFKDKELFHRDISRLWNPSSHK